MHVIINILLQELGHVNGT